MGQRLPIRGKSGLLKDQTCWITPSAREREDSATEKYRLLTVNSEQLITDD